MKSLKRTINKALAIVIAAAVVTAMSFSTGYAADDPETPGLIVSGSGISGQEGFLGNVFYLTQDEIETIKTNKNVSGYDIGESWTENTIYSSHEPHGEINGVTGHYHRSKVSGIDVKKMIAALGTDTDKVKELTYYSSDGYSGILRSTGKENVFGNRYYFAHPNTTAASENTRVPLIALYRADSMGSTFADVQDPGDVTRLPAGENVFVFGQKKYDEDNNCLYGKYVDTIIVDDQTGIFKNGNDSYSNMNIQEILRAGIYKSKFSYGGNSYNVTGLPLTKVMEKMNVTGNEIAVTDAASSKTTVITGSDIKASFLAWGFSDSTATPSEQTSQYALFTPGKVIWNTEKLTTAPSAPANISVTGSRYNSISLKWSASAGADGYTVYRAAGKGVYSKIAETTSTSYIDKSLLTGTKYSYKISAVKKENSVSLESSTGNVVSKTPQLSKSSITSLKKKGRKSASLRWKKVSGAYGYQIRYGTNKKITKSRKTVYVKKGSAKSKTISKLKKGKKYYFKVRAYRTVKGSKKYESWSSVKRIKR